MRLSKSKKIVLLAALLIVAILISVWFFKRKPVATIYKVKKDNFEAVITCKGEIQSEKSIFISIPDVLGDRKLEIWDTQIKDLVPEGSIVKRVIMSPCLTRDVSNSSRKPTRRHSKS